MSIPRLIALAASTAVLIVACGQSTPADSSARQEPATTSSADEGRTTTTDGADPETEPGQTPNVDMSEHSVPLDEIYFDTFDGNSVPLSESTPELRQRLLDAIPPIDNPQYGDVTAGAWLDPDDPVVGYMAGDQAYAYPFKILNFHEIVNDTLDGTPVLVSYCPLCRSAIVYDRRVEGQTLSFGNTSALYESDLVMVDRMTGSYWWQVAGVGIVGPMTGTELTLLPSSVDTWENWKSEHPDTLVLTRDTGYSISYDRDPFAGYGEYLDSGQFAFPVGDAARDDRLAPSALVVGVRINGETRGYAVEDLTEPVSDEVGGEPVVLLPTEGGATVYSPVVDGELLQFESTGQGHFVDTHTRSTWNTSGRAISGPLEGRELAPIPSRTTYWFALVGAFPDVTLTR